MKRRSIRQEMCLLNLADPNCTASSFFQSKTLEALQRKGLAVKHENEMMFRWEITDSGKQYLREAIQ